MKKNKDVDKQIEVLFEHARVANEEMGVIKNHMSVMTNDISWIKETMNDAKTALEKFDTRTWGIIATIIVGILVQIFFKLYK